jgi:hypothetical protein
VIKRVNFTGRKRIPRDYVEIEVVDGTPRMFNATINVRDLGFFDAAAVVVEATCASSPNVMRFDFGTVEETCAPLDRRLHELSGENIIFGVKVIDQTERFGRILGLAENVRPIRTGQQTAAGRRGILPVERVPLGDELWKLDFKTQDVFLLVNDEIPDLADRIRYDAAVYSLIYPEVIRRILYHAIDEGVDVLEDEDRWPFLWLKFGRGLHSTHADPPAAEDPREEKEEWIEDIVGNFCRLHSLKKCYLGSARGNWEA